MSAPICRHDCGAHLLYAVPTGLALRPPMVKGDGLCAQLVRWLYTHRHPHQRMSFHPCIQLCDLWHSPTAAARSLPGQIGGGFGLHPTVCALPSAPPPCCSSSTAALTLPFAWRWLLLWTALPVPSGGARSIGRSVWPKRSAPAAGLHTFFPNSEKNRPDPEHVQSPGSGDGLMFTAKQRKASLSQLWQGQKVQRFPGRSFPHQNRPAGRRISCLGTFSQLKSCTRLWGVRGAEVG